MLKQVVVESGIVLVLTTLLVALAATAGLPGRPDRPARAAEGRCETTVNFPPLPR